MEERDTSAYLAGELRAMGLDVATGVGGTGLVATIGGGTHHAIGGAVGLRAEMDGLALTEDPEAEVRSVHEGRMHACGHDGHMAMLLGAAHLLIQSPPRGLAHLIFQPAEEPGIGARAMLDDGLFDRFPVRSVFGLHNMPGLPAGRLGVRPGPLMASEDNFEIRIRGRGGHAARPEMVVDPIVVAAQIILALQSIVARNVAPTEPAVVSCTEIITDGARNAIPSNVVIRGDVRSFSEETRTLVERRIRQVSEGVCESHGASCVVAHSREFEPTVNDAEATEIAVRAARATPRAHVDTDIALWTASEDFGLLAAAATGCFVLLGTGTTGERGGTPLHSADYVFNDDVLEVGARFLAQVAHDALADTLDESDIR